MSALKVFLVLAVISFSCSKNDEKIVAGDALNNVNSSQTKSTRENFDKNSGDRLEPIVEFERKNGDCFGGCPIYTVSIYSDGKVTFEGKQAVKHLGFAESKLPQSKIEELAANFENADFFKLSDRYLPHENCPQLGADYQTARVFYKKDSLTKTIYHYQGCGGSDELKMLVVLENNIDKIADTNQWIK